MSRQSSRLIGEFMIKVYCRAPSYSEDLSSQTPFNERCLFLFPWFRIDSIIK